MLNKIKNILTLLLIIILLGLGGYYYYKYSNVAHKVDVHKNNISALNDSLKLVKNKAEEYQYQKQAFQLSHQMEIKKLKKLNNELARELKKQKNSKQVKYISKSENEVNKDSFKLDSTIFTNKDSSNKTFQFSHTDSTQNYTFNLNGRLLFNTVYTDSGINYYNSSTYIDDLNFRFDIVHGIKETNNKYKVFIRSPYSGFKIRNMNSAIKIEKRKPDRFIVGPSISAGYDITNNNFPIILGASLTYKIFGF